MSTARLVGVNVAMWTLGIVALGLFGWAVAWLDGRPVEIASSVEVAAVEDGGLATLTAGTARSAATARAHLQQGERGAATHALDAALRAAEVGHESSHGEVKSAFAVGLHAIVRAREALHDGDPAAAVRSLGDTVDALEGAVEPARQMSVGVPPEPVRPGYDGAKLINANGAMLGEVAQVRDGPSPTVVVHAGGWNDWWGLFELGGRTVEVPADRLLWGPRRSLGATFVVLPTEASVVSDP